MTTLCKYTHLVLDLLFELDHEDDDDKLTAR